MDGGIKLGLIGIGTFWLVIASFEIAFSQELDSAKNQLFLDFEIRPRGEYRNNYQLSEADSITPEFFVSQRNRLTLDYRSKKIDLVAAFQEIHLWNKGGVTSTVANVNFYELYIQPKIHKFSLRLGRQRLLLDNGRIFSDAPWAQQSRSHEGARLFYSEKKLETDLSWMFTRTYSSRYDPFYSPVASHRYSYLLMHHLKARLSERITLTTVLAMDSFEDPEGQKKKRFTTGGRLEFFKAKNYVTINGFFQFGQTVGGQTIQAFYLQPELRTQIHQTTFRLGSEILSGNNLSRPEENFRSFVPLYGVAWKFMGNMNFFTRFPADVNSSGLVNPYLFILQRVNSKLSLRADYHLFYSQYPLLDGSKNQVSSFLGSEVDLSFNFRPAPLWDVNFGFSFSIPTESMTLLNKIESSADIPVWSYLMVSFKPTLISKRNIFR